MTADFKDPNTAKVDNVNNDDTDIVAAVNNTAIGEELNTRSDVKHPPIIEAFNPTNGICGDKEVISNDEIEDRRKTLGADTAHL